MLNIENPDWPEYWCNKCGQYRPINEWHIAISSKFKTEWLWRHKKCGHALIIPDRKEEE